ncbi:MAG TPA: VWA domain-containing protein, partial [candidate division Zixibacteria bacterium]|nr:VWA domain-containing protein [candidate division Zixibacteria bacterium]
MRNIAILIVLLTFAIFSMVFASDVPKQPNPETNISAPLSFTIDLSCTTRSGLGSPQVAFCIDMGSSMSSSNFNNAKNIAKAVARELGATPYFIYLGVVTFNDSVNVWDGDPFMPGNNFWNAPSTFTLDIDTARQHGGNDVPNAAWDAIWHAMEDYDDWSITNAKVIVLFTDNSSCARDLRAGTSCCCDTSSSTYVDTIAHPFPAF